MNAGGCGGSHPRGVRFGVDYRDGVERGWKWRYNANKGILTSWLGWGISSVSIWEVPKVVSHVKFVQIGGAQPHKKEPVEEKSNFQIRLPE